MLDRILAPVDGCEQSEAILPYVQELCGRLRTRVVLLHVYPSSMRGQRALHAQYVQSLARQLTDRAIGPIDVEALAVEGRPNEEIARFAARDDIGLIAAAPHSQKSSGHWSIGRTADKVIRETSKPVLLASGLTDSVARTDGLLTRALVPLDGSRASRAVLPFVEAVLSNLSQITEGSLTLMHVVPAEHYAAGPLIARRVPYSAAELTDLRSQALQYLQEVCRGIKDKGVAVKTHVAVGDPAMRIVRAASELGADFIAMTTHGYSGFSRLFLGSVADRVLHTAVTPLLLVKPAQS